MLQSKYRYLIPNGITFISLTCGLVSILAAASGKLYLGGVLVLASYILDLFDGALARRLKAGSAFGLQLDSLVDMVSLGTAPAVLMFFHLQNEGGVAAAWLWPAVVLFPLAGAFRLARFNLLPEKTGSTDSMGLTISTAGATLALAVLSDIAFTREIFPNISFIPLIIGLTLLMVSKIAFPSFAWFFSRRLSYLIVLIFGASVVVVPSFSFANAWLLLTGGYIGVGLARAGITKIRD